MITIAQTVSESPFAPRKGDTFAERKETITIRPVILPHLDFTRKQSVENNPTDRPGNRIICLYELHNFNANHDARQIHMADGNWSVNRRRLRSVLRDDRLHAGFRPV